MIQRRCPTSRIFYEYEDLFNRPQPLSESPLSADEKHARLRQLARHRGISVNKLIEELATVSLAEFDAETRFRALAATGSVEQGLALLDKLDQAFEAGD